MLAVSALLGLATAHADGVYRWPNGVGVGIAVLLLAAASWMVGSILGFLFGMPRSRLTDQVTLLEGKLAAGVPGRTPAARFLANANLIKVSDWLTTIVIGLGLVNLGKVVPAFRDLGGALREPLGGAPYAGAVGLSVLVAGSLAGFMLCYLWTSMRVRELLEESEHRSGDVHDEVESARQEAQVLTK